MHMTKKYLIVDDNDEMRELLCIMFCDNADILTARNGQEALALIKSHYVDIILTDYNMPVMNGIEFLKQANKTESDIYLHAILLTGSIDKEVRLFSERHSIPLIYKPFRESKLKETINTLFERSRVIRPSDNGLTIAR